MIQYNRNGIFHTPLKEETKKIKPKITGKRIIAFAFAIFLLVITVIGAIE